MLQLTLKFKRRYKHRPPHKNQCKAYLKVLPEGYRAMISWGPEENKSIVVLRTYPSKEVAVSTMRQVAVDLRLAYRGMEVIHAKAV